MVPIGERPHPRRSDRRGCRQHDAADDGTVGENIKVIGVPLAALPRSRCALALPTRAAAMTSNSTSGAR